MFVRLFEACMPLSHTDQWLQAVEGAMRRLPLMDLKRKN
jgi:hypothetical protein